MTMIKVNYEGALNIIAKTDKGIMFNGKKLLTSYHQIKDEKEKKEAFNFYKEEIENGTPEKIAKIKAALYFAPYIEEGDVILNEIIDTIIIALLGYYDDFAFKKDFTIYIKDNYIFSDRIDKEKKYFLPTTGSSVAFMDWKALLAQLEKDI